MNKFNQRGFISLLCVIVIGTGILFGCSSLSTSKESRQTRDNYVSRFKSTAVVEMKESRQTMDNYVPRLEGTAVVEMIVNGSPITIEVNGNEAPITAGNFVDLVERGFYNGLTFHRVVKKPEPFVAQGGDPKGTGTGGFVDPQTQKDRYIPLEIKRRGEETPLYGEAVGAQAGFSAPSVVLNHKRGAIAMARSQAPNSASSQFYFALTDIGFLDGDYAVFGYVTKGMEIVDGIKQGDRMTAVKVVSGAENLKK